MILQFLGAHYAPSNAVLFNKQSHQPKSEKAIGELMTIVMKYCLCVVQYKK